MPEHSPQTLIKVDLFQSKASSRKRNKKDWSLRAPANYINIHQQISFHCLKFHHVCKKGFLHSIERWPLWWHKSHPPIAATPGPVTRSLALTESHPFLWKCVMFFHGYGRGWFGFANFWIVLGSRICTFAGPNPWGKSQTHSWTPNFSWGRFICFMFYMFLKNSKITWYTQVRPNFRHLWSWPCTRHSRDDFGCWPPRSACQLFHTDPCSIGVKVLVTKKLDL